MSVFSEHFRRKIEEVKRAHRIDGERANEAMFDDFLSAVEDEIQRLRMHLVSTTIGTERQVLRSTLRKMKVIKGDLYRRFNRKPPGSGLSVPAEPSKGPFPMQGGAEAPLAFDRA